MTTTTGYKLVGETSFHEKTDHRICALIEFARKTEQKLRFHYGDIETGRDWMEENDVIGYIGRSTGSIKIPLLLARKTSISGGGLLDSCIVKMTDVRTGIVIYQHPKYATPLVEITPSDLKPYTHNTVVNGEIYGRHLSLKEAQKLKKFIIG